MAGQCSFSDLGLLSSNLNKSLVRSRLQNREGCQHIFELEKILWKISDLAAKKDKIENSKKRANC